MAPPTAVPTASRMIVTPSRGAGTWPRNDLSVAARSPPIARATRPAVMVVAFIIAPPRTQLAACIGAATTGTAARCTPHHGAAGVELARDDDVVSGHRSVAVDGSAVARREHGCRRGVRHFLAILRLLVERG